MTPSQMASVATYFTTLAENEGFVLSDDERQQLSQGYDLGLVRRLFDRINFCYLKRDNIMGLRTVPKHLDRKTFDSLVPEHNLKMYYKYKELWLLQLDDVIEDMDSDDAEQLIADLRNRLTRVEEELRALDSDSDEAGDVDA